MIYLLIGCAAATLGAGAAVVLWAWVATEPKVDEPFDERHGGDQW